MKVPHATSDDGSKLWFKAQAIYVSDASTSFSDARSLHVDVRDLSPEHVVKLALAYLDKSLALDEIARDLLEKGVARGGKYYKRVATGKVDRPYRYFYTREAYEKEHGGTAHRRT